MGKNNLSGAWGEALAADYLRKKRYEIVAVGYHSRFGEIDIIAQKDDAVVFAEVKTRSSDRFARAFNRLHGDIARIAVGHHDVHVAQHNLPALNVSHVVNARGRLQSHIRLLVYEVALVVFRAVVQKPDRRVFNAVRRLCVRRAHQGEMYKIDGLTFQVCTAVANESPLAPMVRHDRTKRGAGNAL